MTRIALILVLIGLGGRKIARETNIEKAVVDDHVEWDVQGDRGSGLERAVGRHVLLGDSVGVGATFRLVGEMHPAEFLERRHERGIVAITVDRLVDRLIVGKGEAISERHEVGTAGAFHLDREADKIRLGLVHVHADEAHALAAPQFHAQAISLFGIGEIAQTCPPGIGVARATCSKLSSCDITCAGKEFTE
jgi:hypothetical protein